MQPDDRDLAKGLRLAVVAVVSALATATVVIGAGQSLIQPDDAAAPATPPELIRASVG